MVENKHALCYTFVCCDVKECVNLRNIRKQD